MTYTSVSWAYQEVVSSSKLNLMAANEADADARLDALEAAPPVATSLVPAGAWVPYGAPFGAPKVQVDGDRVDLSGTVKSGAPGTLFVSALPTDAWPATTRIFLCAANAGVADVRISNAGVVSLSGYYAGGTNGIVSLDGIHYRAGV